MIQTNYQKMKFKAPKQPNYDILVNTGQFVLSGEVGTPLNGTFYYSRCLAIYKNGYSHSETRPAISCKDTSGTYRICGFNLKWKGITNFN